MSRYRRCGERIVGVYGHGPEFHVSPVVITGGANPQAVSSCACVRTVPLRSAPVRLAPVRLAQAELPDSPHWFVTDEVGNRIEELPAPDGTT